MDYPKFRKGVPKIVQMLGGNGMYTAVYNSFDLHVSASNREVIRAARNWMKPEARRGPKYRDRRHRLYRIMLREHDDAAELYWAVTEGFAP